MVIVGLLDALFVVQRRAPTKSKFQGNIDVGIQFVIANTVETESACTAPATPFQPEISLTAPDC
jgi:hypothetical protein